MKELDAPPAHPVKWVARVRDGRETIVEAKLWYAARAMVCQGFGVSEGDVVELHVMGTAGENRVCALELDMLPDFTMFTGPAVDPGIGDAWDLFSIDGGRVPDDAVLIEALRNGIVLAFDSDGMWMTPQWDSDALDPKDPRAYDNAACLAYLNSGGRLVKLPDHIGSKYNRLYPIVHFRRLPAVAKDGDMER